MPKATITADQQITSWVHISVSVSLQAATVAVLITVNITCRIHLQPVYCTKCCHNVVIFAGFTVNNCDSLRRRLYEDNHKYSIKIHSEDSVSSDSPTPLGKKYSVLPKIRSHCTGSVGGELTKVAWDVVYIL